VIHSVTFWQNNAREIMICHGIDDCFCCRQVVSIAVAVHHKTWMSLHVTVMSAQMTEKLETNIDDAFAQKAFK